MTIKMLETIRHVLFSNDDILFFDEYFRSVTFFTNQMGILSVDLYKSLLTLMILILIKVILKLLFMSNFWLDVINFKNVKH